MGVAVIKNSRKFTHQARVEIKDVCGTLSKQLCIDDKLHQQAADGSYLTSMPNGSKLGWVTHRDGRKAGLFGNPRRRRGDWGENRRRQAKPYGAPMGKKKLYTPDHALVFFDNGYVNTYSFFDLQLCDGNLFPTPAPPTPVPAEKVAAKEAAMKARMAVKFEEQS